MERFTAAHRKLQIFCADYWSSQESCQIILDEVGLNSNRLDLSEPSLMRWYSIINEMIKKNDGALGRLVIVLMKDYPDNKALRDVCAPWIPAEPAKPSDLIAQPQQAGSTSSPTNPAVEAEKKPAQTATEEAEDVLIPKGAVLVTKFPIAAPMAPDAAPVAEPDKPPARKAKSRTPEEFAIEEETMLSRVETLWLAVVDQEQRLVELEKTSRKKETDIAKAADEA